MLSQMEGFPSFSWLNAIHYIFIILCYIIYINNIFFIHSSSAHRGCFYILATVNNATWLWEYRYLFEILISFSLAIYPEVELLSHMVHFSCSIMSDFLWPHGLQNARLPHPSPTPGVYSNSCPLSQWCHPAISSPVIPFSSYLQSFTASGCFQMSQFFTSGGQSIGVLASASVLPMNIQDWFPLGWAGWISLLSKGLSRVSPTPQFKSIISLALSFLYGPTLTSIHDYWKNHSFD